MSLPTFDGFPTDAIDFFTEIRFNNNKEWFAANKKRFQTNVQKPAQQFVVALGERLLTLSDNVRFDTKLTGSGSIMRIYRDIRFSKDKTPYKTNMGIVWWEGYGKKVEEPGFYFHMDADGCWMAGGLYHFDARAMSAWRRMVDDDGDMLAEVKQVVAELTADGYGIGGDMYKRVPRGFPKDHPEAELLKRKGLHVGQIDIPMSLLHSPELVDVAFAHCQHIYKLQNWAVRMLGSYADSAESESSV